MAFQEIMDRSRNHSRRLVAVVIATVLVFCVQGCEQAGNRQARKKSSAEFDKIRSLATSGKYADAKPQLEAFLKANPKHVDASRAGLFLGKVNIALGDFGAAQKAFEMVIATYPGTLEDHKCRYKLAVLTMLQGNNENAIERFSSLADQPDGPLAAEAVAMRKYLQARGK